MSTLWQDLKYGVRMLLKTPGFTLVAVIALAVGIGVNTAIFSFINALLLRPLPGVAEPGRLVLVGRSNNGQGFDTISYPDYVDFRDQNTVFSGLAAYSNAALHLSTGGEAERVPGAFVSGNYFTTLGVRAALGRTLLPEDDNALGSNPVAVISHGLWERRFGSDPNIAGKAVSLNAHPYTIVGVAAEGFAGMEVGEKRDIWLPVTMYGQVVPVPGGGKVEDFFAKREMVWLNAFARPKPGVTLERAQAELAGLARNLEQAYPKTNKGRGVSLVPGLGVDPLMRASVRYYTGLLMAVVALVLLVACANVANLLLVRATARQREIGVRLALGAKRARLIRQLLTESILLALIGGAAGLVVGFCANKMLAQMLPAGYMSFPLALDLSLDARVLAFAFVVSLSTGVVFGVAPALVASKPDLVTILKDAPAAGRSLRRSKLRGVLVVGQVALSLLVLVLAGLFVRTLRNAQAIEPGFEAEHVLTMTVDLGRQGYSEEQGQSFYRQLIERTESLPGVKTASLARTVPLRGSSLTTGIRPEGRPPDEQPVQTDSNWVAPRYFEAMNIPLLLGRDFTAQDQAQDVAVAIINETLARQLWPNENPLGRRFRMPAGLKPELKTVEVVGVVKDIKHRSLFEPPRPFVYMPLSQNYQQVMTLHVRTVGDPALLVAPIQREVQALDKNLPVFNVKTLAAQLEDALTPQRLAATLVSAFGLMALVLAAIGVYGVISYAVTQRTHEIGIRMSLGAQRLDVLRLVIGQGMTLALIGVALGLLAAFAAARVIASLLYGVSATDPATIAGVSLLLVGVMLLACYLPARRATKVDPMVALRHE